MATDPVVYVDLYQGDNKTSKAGRPQKWRWRAINEGNRKTMATSAEAYTNRQDCLDAIQQLFGAATTVYLRQTGHAPETTLRHGGPTAITLPDPDDEGDDE